MRSLGRLVSTLFFIAALSLLLVSSTDVLNQEEKRTISTIRDVEADSSFPTSRKLLTTTATTSSSSQEATILPCGVNCEISAEQEKEKKKKNSNSNNIATIIIRKSKKEAQHQQQSKQDQDSQDQQQRQQKLGQIQEENTLQEEKSDKDIKDFPARSKNKITTPTSATDSSSSPPSQENKNQDPSSSSSEKIGGLLPTAVMVNGVEQSDTAETVPKYGVPIEKIQELNIGGSGKLPILVLYAYSPDHYNYDNALFFLQHGTKDPLVEYVFIVSSNVHSSTTPYIPPYFPSHVHVVRRRNYGYDFCAYKEIAMGMGTDVLRRFEVVILLNASVRGPFVPSYMDSLLWASYLAGLLHGKVKMVGTAINCASYCDKCGGRYFREYPELHIQSMLVALDQKMFTDIIVPVLGCEETKGAAITRYEVQMARILLNLGFETVALMYRWRGISLLEDEEPVFDACKSNKYDKGGNVLFDGFGPDGEDLNAIEMMFIKDGHDGHRILFAQGPLKVYTTAANRNVDGDNNNSTSNGNILEGKIGKDRIVTNNDAEPSVAMLGVSGNGYEGSQILKYESSREESSSGGGGSSNADRGKEYHLLLKAAQRISGIYLGHHTFIEESPTMALTPTVSVPFSRIVDDTRNSFSSLNEDSDKTVLFVYALFGEQDLRNLEILIQTGRLFPLDALDAGNEHRIAMRKRVGLRSEGFGGKILPIIIVFCGEIVTEDNRQDEQESTTTSSSSTPNRISREEIERVLLPSRQAVPAILMSAPTCQDKYCAWTEAVSYLHRKRAAHLTRGGVLDKNRIAKNREVTRKNKKKRKGVIKKVISMNDEGDWIHSHAGDSELGSAEALLGLEQIEEKEEEKEKGNPFNPKTAVSSSSSSTSASSKEEDEDLISAVLEAEEKGNDSSGVKSEGKSDESSGGSKSVSSSSSSSSSGNHQHHQQISTTIPEITTSPSFATTPSSTSSPRKPKRTVTAATVSSSTHPTTTFVEDEEEESEHFDSLLLHEETHVFMLDSSSAGPFVPLYASQHWLSMMLEYLEKKQPGKKILAASIRCPPSPSSLSSSASSSPRIESPFFLCSGRDACNGLIELFRTEGSNAAASILRDFRKDSSPSSPTASPSLVSTNDFAFLAYRWHNVPLESFSDIETVCAQIPSMDSVKIHPLETIFAPVRNEQVIERGGGGVAAVTAIELDSGWQTRTPMVFSEWIRQVIRLRVYNERYIRVRSMIMKRFGIVIGDMDILHTTSNEEKAIVMSYGFRELCKYRRPQDAPCTSEEWEPNDLVEFDVHARGNHPKAKIIYRCFWHDRHVLGPDVHCDLTDPTPNAEGAIGWALREREEGTVPLRLCKTVLPDNSRFQFYTVVDAECAEYDISRLLGYVFPVPRK